MHMHESLSDVKSDVRESVRKVGAAAESQATLNIALTGVCLAALMVACLLVVHSQRTEAGL